MKQHDPEDQSSMATKQSDTLTTSLCATQDLISLSVAKDVSTAQSETLVQTSFSVDNSNPTPGQDDEARVARVAQLKARYEAGNLLVDDQTLAARLVDSHIRHSQPEAKASSSQK